jgi:hypothetical protein
MRVGRLHQRGEQRDVVAGHPLRGVAGEEVGGELERAGEPVAVVVEVEAQI